MLRYKTETRPGLVALYDIRPGNRAGQFLQPRSPHGAISPVGQAYRTGTDGPTNHHRISTAKTCISVKGTKAT